MMHPLTIYMHPDGRGDFRKPCGFIEVGPVLSRGNGKTVVSADLEAISQIRDRIGFSYPQPAIEATA